MEFTASRLGSAPFCSKGSAIVSILAVASCLLLTASATWAQDTIWPPSAVPVVPSVDDPSAVELGVKFRADVDGLISGVRFYKGPDNGGTHVGSLWTAAGSLLASATFTSETATGWQEVSFSSPVAIVADTTYVASYHAPQGGYAGRGGYFSDGGVDSPPLRALADGEDGGNGIYMYGGGGFPVNSWNASNYWVDVVFTPSEGSDTTSPTVLSVSPADGATEVGRTSVTMASFDEAIDETSLNSSTFELRDGTGALVSATISWDALTLTATLTADPPLEAGTAYTATVRGGAGGVTDTAGNPLASDFVWTFTTEQLTGICAAPPNEIVAENCLPGSPADEWDITGGGDPGIQGYATDISVNRGQTVSFKVATDASDYRLDIYRIGYYDGMGARKVMAIEPSAVLPQTQPACLEDAATGLVDCGNWSVSASWAVPATAVSGVYLGKLVREDGTPGTSHIIFIVRDDEGGSDLLFQTADTSWHAYNRYGGNSLYFGDPVGRAYKVSYNRPFTTRDCCAEDWFFNAEYPMIRWLEANGYDVSYFTGVDTQRSPAEILEHTGFLSVGHDEYWSAGQRSNVEAARDAGVHLAFFSGNEIFWKTRWENSIDGSDTPLRTMVCYKETLAGAKIDPEPDTWTGTWRDPSFSPPADGGNPENALTGTIFTVNCCSYPLQVPAEDGKLRFWRNTAIAAQSPGQTFALPDGTLGYEWDEDLDNGSRPPGLIRLSTTTVDVPGRILDQGSSYGPGTATHHLTLYRAASGALVFGAGTLQWSWGLDSEHEFPAATADPNMKQATVNLFADMGVQPANLEPGLVPATQSTDSTGPISSVTSPPDGTGVETGEVVTVTGTAVDTGGGLVGGVEVSVDGGASWHPTTGRNSWSYTFTAEAPDTLSILSRATDDSGNMEGNATDTTPPTVTATSPADGASAVLLTTVVTATFSEGIDPATLNGTTFELLDGVGSPVAATISYDDLSFTATLTPASPLLAPFSYTATAKGGPSGVTDVVGNALAADFVWSFTTADITPPAVVTSTPIDGAVDVPVASSVTATFAEPLDPATVGGSTFELRDGSGGLVPAVVSYDPPTATAVLTPSTRLTSTTTYTATLVGGATGIKDLAGNPLPADSVWTFTTDAGCPCTIWPEGTVPAVASENDSNALEIGVRFQTDFDGYITHLRFYKGLENTGTHVGNLWTSAGSLLASATFVDETATGWQAVALATPVVVTSNTTYVASYHAPVGRYAAAPAYFASSGFNRSPLRALADGEDGANGVYLYGSSGFPTQSFNSTNYWVDVTFSYDLSAENIPPTVASVSPASGATGVAPVAPVTATFDESMDPASIHGGTFELRDSFGSLVTSSVSYDEATLTATLTPSAALTPSTVFTATVVGDEGGVRDLAGNALAADFAWSFTTTDLTEPVVIAVSPTIGAIDSSLTTAVVAEFDETMDPATVDASTFELRGPGGGLVAAVVSYDATSNAAVLTPDAPLSGETVYTATVIGGASGVTDLAGNALEADFLWSFTTQAGCPCTIWPDGTEPTVAAENDSSAVEVGVRFQTDAAGYITNIRFYKGSGNTGTHVGNLWTADGTLLASATFTNETVTGWQEVALAPPVAVIADTTYVASYHAPAGRYANDGGYFAVGGVDNSPLRALADDGSGPNGVYLYGSGGFPTGTWNSSNYWVDVVFNYSLTDTTPPTVLAVAPTDGATDVFPSSSVTASFDEPIDPSTIDGTTFEFRDSAGGLVAASVAYDPASRVATLDPDAVLLTFATYTATLRGGANGVKDLAGNALANDFVWTFTTSDGPDCPCTIWDIATTPSVLSVSDSSAVEVGVRFRTDTDGFVTGLRFFKGIPNTGTHVGNLWTAEGTLLASATFSGETASGWQQVDLVDPVPVSANQTYIASYHAPEGGYAEDTLYFSASGVTSSPLTALADGEDGGNGLFAYGPSAFPTETYVSSNYWIDVVFDTEVISDGIPPTVVSTLPGDGAIDVSAATAVTATFDEGMSPASVSGTTFELRDEAGNPVAAAVVYQPLDRTAVLTPTVRLDAITTYTATVLSGPGGVKDLAGIPLSADFSWSFTTAPPDLTSPSVSSVSPEDGTARSSVSTVTTATFTEAMDVSTVNDTAFELRDAGGSLIPSATAYDTASATATLTPQAPLVGSTTYTATVLGGASGVKDLVGNPMDADFAWSFTTGPPPDKGPGGPILIITADLVSFGDYLPEIVRNEGLNEFEVLSLSQVDGTTLAAFDVVLLGETPLSADQATMLTDWVDAGGNLVAMRPDKQLAGLLGLIDASATLAEGYLAVDAGPGSVGEGIVAETLQYHGTADLYTLDTATAVATLYSDANTATSYPAVTLNAVGINGGEAASFTFDLARSVVYTRQGNPAWDGQDRDGVAPIRAFDLFYGPASLDPQPDYVDFAKLAIPQADEQQRLLANLVLSMNLDRMPLPRFWYLPRGEKAVVIMTGDDHATGGTAGRFDIEIAASPIGCSVADWECVRSSSYIYTETPLSSTEAIDYRGQGFEIALHVNTGCENDWTPATIGFFYDDQLASFTAKYGGTPAPATNRTHCIAWSDYVTQPKVEFLRRIRLDTTYYYYFWPLIGINENPGVFTGSGMPMRFADLDGSIIDVYQAVTQMTDESGQAYPATVDSLLDKALGPEGFYGAFATNMHTDQVSIPEHAEIVASAQARGVPIVSSQQMLEWLDGRNNSAFQSLAWDGITLAFDIAPGQGANGLQAMVPASSASGSLIGITRDGGSVFFTLETIKGREYAVFDAAAGSYEAVY